MRGSLPLSEAENWFIPQRLMPGMRDLLAATDIPFGTAIAPLNPFRRTLSVRFPDLTSRGSEKTSQDGCGIEWSLPNVVLEHQAIVMSEAGEPLAVVQEGFRSELVSFALPIHGARQNIPEIPR